MATKSASGMDCVQPEIKLPIEDEQFNQMMEAGYAQAKANQGLPIEEAFAQIREEI